MKRTTLRLLPQRTQLTDGSRRLGAWGVTGACMRPQRLPRLRSPTTTLRCGYGALRPTRRFVGTKHSQEGAGAATPQAPPPAGWQLHRTGGLIGSAMGFFGGLVGQGGGVVGIPLMTSLGRLTQHQAHGTSLVAVASTGLAGALAYWQAGGAEEGVDTLAALMLAGSASLFAGLGARLSKRVSSPNLKKYMGAFMVAASVSVAVKAYSDYPDHRGSLTSTVASAASANAVASPVLSMSDKAALLTPARIATIGAIGAVTGFASGFLGIGGGLVMVPLLTLCTSMHQSQVLGTSLLAMVIPAVVGSWTHLRLGNVFVPIVPSMVAGTLVGGYLGGKLSTNLTQTQQRAIVSITIFTLALRMLRK